MWHFTEHTNQSSESKVKPLWAAEAEISISVGSCQTSSDMLVYCQPLAVPQASLLNERQQVFMALHKNAPAVRHHSRGDKTLYLLLPCLSHSEGQAGACFMCLIDTWARGLTQMLHSLCSSTNKTTRRSLSLPETNRGAGRSCWRALSIAR